MSWLEHLRAERIKWLVEQCLRERKTSREEIRAFVISKYPSLSLATIDSYTLAVFNVMHDPQEVK